MTEYFYTATVYGKQFATSAPYYQWQKATEFLGIKRENLKRGTDAGLPLLSKEIMLVKYLYDRFGREATLEAGKEITKGKRDPFFIELLTHLEEKESHEIDNDTD